MNSGPSATFGIMFSVTNSGSNSRLTSGDQQNSTASVTPTKAPSAEAAEDFRRGHGEVGDPGIFRRVQRRKRRKRRGQDEFRHLEGVDQDLPQHDHGEMHDQDDREGPYADRRPSLVTACSSGMRPPRRRAAPIYRGRPRFQPSG